MGSDTRQGWCGIGSRQHNVLLQYVLGIACDRATRQYAYAHVSIFTRECISRMPPERYTARRPFTSVFAAVAIRTTFTSRPIEGRLESRFSVFNLRPPSPPLRLGMPSPPRIPMSCYCLALLDHIQVHITCELHYYTRRGQGTIASVSRFS